MPQCDAHYITQKNKNQSKYLYEITPSASSAKNINNYDQGGNTHDTHKNTKRTGCVPDIDTICRRMHRHNTEIQRRRNNRRPHH